MLMCLMKSHHIYGNLIYLKNWKISSDEITGQILDSQMAVGFNELNFLGVEIVCT